MLFDDGFVFGGKSTAEFFAHAEKYPPQGAPARKRDTITVPGRNGDLHIVQNAFENYIQPYELYFHDPDRASPQSAHSIKSWLMAAKGYQRLEDVYDPEHYRMACFYGPLDISNQLNKYGRCAVQFDCKPQAFLKVGEQPVVFTEASVIYNPCAFPASPLIYLYGSGAGTLSILDTTVEVKELDAVLVLDCDLQTAYAGSVNKNNTIYAPEFPSLLPGENAIAWTGGIAKVEIVPRWWEL